MASSGRLTWWQWVVLAALWIPGPVIWLWGEYPREEPWRQALIKPRLIAVESDREAAFRRLAAQCQSGDKFDLISPQRRVEYAWCMEGRKGDQEALRGAYLRAKAAITDEVDRSVRDDLPRAQWRVIGKGIALWLVPLLALYAFSLAFVRLSRGFWRQG